MKTAMPAATESTNTVATRPVTKVLVTKEDSRKDAIAAEQAISFGVTIDYDGTVHQNK